MTKTIEQIEEQDKSTLELIRDPVFKAFMSDDETLDFKSEFLSTITGLDEELFKKAEYRIEELPVNNKKDKVYKTDIIVRVDKNIINVEMNNGYYDELIIKNNQYINKLKGDIYDRGEEYSDEIKIIQINIDNYSQYEGNKFLYEFRVLEVDTHILGDKNYVKYHIDLTKINDKCYNDPRIKKLQEECQIFVTTKYSKLKKLKGGKAMEKAVEALMRISNDEKIIGLYDAEAVERKVLNTRLNSAKRKGIAEGKIEVARNFKNAGIDIKIISENTGLSIEEIENL